MQGKNSQYLEANKEKVRCGKRKPQPTRKPMGVTARVYITSLNSHFPLREHHHKMLNRKRSRSSAAFFGK